jgi:hypothetical protein
MTSADEGGTTLHADFITLVEDILWAERNVSTDFMQTYLLSAFRERPLSLCKEASDLRKSQCREHGQRLDESESIPAEAKPFRWSRI